MRAARALLTLGIGEAIGRGGAIIFTLAIARLAGLQFLAQLSLAQSLLAYATVAADAGLTAHAVRRLNSGEDSVLVAKETTSVQTILCLATILIVAPLAASRTGWQMVLLVALQPLALSVAPTYLLQGTGRFRALASARALGSLITCAVGLGLLWGGAARWSPVAYTAGALLTLVVVAHDSSGGLVPLVRTLTFNIKGRWITASGWLIVQTLVVHAYSSFVLVAANLALSERQFASLATALKLQSYLVIPAVLMQTVLLTAFVRGEVSPLLATIGLGALGLAITVPVYAFTSTVLTLTFGAAAINVVPIARVICWQVPLAYVSTSLLATLVARGRYGLGTAIYGIALTVLVGGSTLFGRPSPISLSWAMVGAEATFVLLLGFAAIVRVRSAGYVVGRQL